MITRKPYESDEPQPAIHYEVTVGGKLLCRNQEVTLERGIGYPAGRYRFDYAEELANGTWCLVFFGPVRRSKQRYRHLWRDGSAVRVIHRRRPTLDQALAPEEVLPGL